MPTPAATGRRAGLDPDDVIDAALALVAEGGADGLTMRKLAAHLDVAPNTIYWHVGGRDELILAAIERQSARQAARPIEGTTPRERVASLATNVWANALEHRNITALAHQIGATSLLQRPMEEAMDRELAAAGLADLEVLEARRAILACVAGYLVVTMRGGTDDGVDLPRLFRRTLGAVVAEYVPAAGDAGEGR